MARDSGLMPVARGAAMTDHLAPAGAARTLRRHAPGALAEVAANIAAPALIFTLAHHRIGDAPALMLAAAPPILWSLALFVRQRRLDALSLLVLAGIALSLLAFFGGGGVKFLQLREQLVTGIIGLVFLGSAAIGRPIIAPLARARARRHSAAAGERVATLSDHPEFRRTMMVLTLVWGAGLVAEAALACALVFVLSIRTFLIVSPTMGYGAMAAAIGWSFWYGRRKIAPLPAITPA